MHLHHLQKFRRLLPAICRYCDRQFFYKPAGRPRLFCDHVCQQRDFRRPKGGPSGCDESRGKNQVGSTISKVDFADRPSVLIGPSEPPMNIVGGYKFPNAAAVDRTSSTPPKTEQQKFSPEQQRRLAELRAQIPDDLSIPTFMQRGQS